MSAATPPIVSTSMLIRRPIEAVFEAFVDPVITAKFWFSDGVGRLDRIGARAVWNWRWYGASAWVTVLAVEAPNRLVYSWGGETDAPTRVEYELQERMGGTLMTVRHLGFAGSETEQIATAMDSLGGFTLVLAGAKAWLEHGLVLGLVPDRFPDAHTS